MKGPLHTFCVALLLFVSLQVGEAKGFRRVRNLSYKDVKEPENCLHSISPGSVVKYSYTILDERGDQVQHVGKDRPAEFVIGKGHTYKAFDEGMIGMCPGGQRKISAPHTHMWGDYAFGTVKEKESVRILVDVVSVDGVDERMRKLPPNFVGSPHAEL
mmetsp:Transcript_7041/g.8074  ORF Transcript_7041/g.8074 Transcript_7041/m.8074 type:complete len:158 (+) Transcript_7041:61-534(+)|eukprot:CAMPEP_0197850968 /NCGR_PEP_ID=MMETSP1438-20131217/16892_1 /TAXON_ID=1461541 /ORGANISM="Pterosperma sp., Strain CCMP1384" /LENGTH=157 /DNA_ID=CAMNT_0043464403 /DNA_START=44 /DNA_END=517 /DNA_ORIENTATION=+